MTLADRQGSFDRALPLLAVMLIYASFAVRRSETLPMIGKLLGHAKQASTARYAQLDDCSERNANERIA